jgi:uncharacterized protein (DUF2062 family)
MRMRLNLPNDIRPVILFGYITIPPLFYFVFETGIWLLIIFVHNPTVAYVRSQKYLIPKRMSQSRNMPLVFQAKLYELQQN